SNAGIILHDPVTDSRTANSTGDLAAALSDAGWTANAAADPPQPRLEVAEDCTSLDGKGAGIILHDPVTDSRTENATSDQALAALVADAGSTANVALQPPQPRLDGAEHFTSHDNGAGIVLHDPVTDSRTGNSTSDQALAASVSDAGWTANVAAQSPQPQLDSAAHEYFTSLDSNAGIILHDPVTDSRTANSTGDMASSFSDASCTANVATEPPQPRL